MATAAPAISADKAHGAREKLVPIDEVILSAHYPQSTWPRPDDLHVGRSGRVRFRTRMEL